jgi:hypothetical protein
MSLDLTKTLALLAELREVEEEIADRGPIKVLPRPPSEIPDFPKLKARMEQLFVELSVQRNYKKAKGHDLGGPQKYDLTAVGVVEEVKYVEQGADDANKSSTTLVRVLFPAGEHLWFDPDDLDPFDLAALQ